MRNFLITQELRDWLNKNVTYSDQMYVEVEVKDFVVKKIAHFCGRTKNKAIKYDFRK